MSARSGAVVDDVEDDLVGHLRRIAAPGRPRRTAPRRGRPRGTGRGGRRGRAPSARPGTMSTTPVGHDRSSAQVQREHVLERRHLEQQRAVAHRQHAGGHHGARTSTPSSSSAARTARAIATAAGRVAVEAEGCRVRRDRGAVDRLDHALAGEPHRPCRRRPAGRRAGRRARRAGRASRRRGSRGRGTPRARTAGPRAAAARAISPSRPRIGSGRPSRAERAATAAATASACPRSSTTAW